MATAEGLYPKVGGDPPYASEYNASRGFGDGTDGAFDESAASTTNLTQGTIYQYSSFSLGASHTISATTTSDKPIVILVQGNATINGTISLTGKGKPTTTGYYVLLGESSFATAGNTGQSGTFKRQGGKAGGHLFNIENGYKLGSIMNGTGGGDSGNGGSSGGAGGGGGASASNDGVTGTDQGEITPGTTGKGGAGGCTIIMIVGGTLTFGASSSIDVSGADGTDGVGGAAGGGGGGGSGDIMIFHSGTKTDNGVTTDVTGGAGGSPASGAGVGGAGGAGRETIASFNTLLMMT